MTAEDDLKCGKCKQPLSAHRHGTPCRLFVGPATAFGADAERAAVVAWLADTADWAGYYEWCGWKPWRWLKFVQFFVFRQTVEAITEAIERGEHIKGKD